MKTGNAFRYQSCHGQIGAVAEHGGELIYRQCGGGNIGSFYWGSAAAEHADQKATYQNTGGCFQTKAPPFVKILPFIIA